MRRNGWLYLRLHWSRRWNDDASCATSVLGYELKTAVGTSVFVMAFTAFTGSVSHFAIGGAPDWWTLAFCMISTLVFAQIAAFLANKAKPENT